MLWMDLVLKTNRGINRESPTNPSSWCHILRCDKSVSVSGISTDNATIGLINT